MELSRNEFSYQNGIFNNDIDYIIDLINKEILSLHNIKNNVKRFAFHEVKNSKLGLIKFNSLIDEVSRISVEISILEQKKNEYLRIKENL
jgi:hypothetical protein